MDVTYEIEQAVKPYLSGMGSSGPDNITSKCPFHFKSDGSQERSASFAMNKQTGLYLCHSCGAKGNLYTFFRDLGLPRTEIQLNFQPLIDAAKTNLPATQNPLRAEVFDKNPLDHRVLGLLDYEPSDLIQSGFRSETLRHFDVGFDRWHYRTTYPIRDLGGSLVAISGRSVHADVQPRYKIYDKEYMAWGLPPREGWKRGNVLYNGHRLYAGLYHARERAEIVIVEGFKACMWVHQAGFTNVGALLGHYLSQPQMWILQDLTSGGGYVYMFLDNNWQGWHGCETAGRQLARGTKVKVMMYPERLREDDNAQPDSCTPEEIHHAKETAIDFYSFRAMRA